MFDSVQVFLFWSVALVYLNQTHFELLKIVKCHRILDIDITSKGFYLMSLVFKLQSHKDAPNGACS